MSKQFVRLTFLLLLSMIILALSLEVIWEKVEPSEQGVSVSLLFKSKEKAKDNFYQLVPRSTLLWSEAMLKTLKSGSIVQLENDQGETYFYKKLAEDVQIVGPFVFPQEGRFNANIVSLLFYSGFVIILILWFRPAFIDFKRLSRSIQIFSRTAKWNEVNVKKASVAFPMVDTLNAMASRITQLITLQKSLSRMIGHEIRTPLARSQFSIASLKCEPSLEEILSIEEDLEEIEQLTDEFLKITKLEFDSEDLNLTLQYPRGIVDELSSQLNCQSRIQIINQVDAKFQAQIEVKTFKRLLQNLISNALKHADNKIIVRMFILNDYYHLSVSDDGQGFISYNPVKEPFYQENNNLDGYGLGLSIVKMISGWYDGDISLSCSNELHGAKVTFKWPLYRRGEPLE